MTGAACSTAGQGPVTGGVPGHRGTSLDFLSRAWCAYVNRLLPGTDHSRSTDPLTIRLVEAGPAAARWPRPAGGRVALVAAGNLVRFARARLLTDVVMTATRASLWELVVSDDDYVFWSLYGDGRSRLAGNFRRLFEQLPSDAPLVARDVRAHIRDVTNPASLGHLRSTAWKETAP